MKYYKIGEKVDFIYVNKKTKKYHLIRNSKITNSYYEDKFLKSFPGNLKDKYYFRNDTDHVQGCWIHKDFVFAPGSFKLWNSLYE